MAKKNSSKASTPAKKAVGDAGAAFAPFTAAPAALQPFLAHLDTSKVYITHIDTLPWRFKRRIFSVPVVLNLSIAALLGWRWYVIAPVYWSILLSMLGNRTAATVNVAETKWSELIWIIIKRALMILLDFSLVRFIAEWPLTFFFEQPGNPVLWRWRVGFQDAELIVRVSRQWGAADLVGSSTSDPTMAKGQNSPFFKTRLAPAIDQAYMRGKTGYLMMGKDWDLDFALMVTGWQLVQRGEMRLDDFQKTVLVHADRDGWLSWRAYDVQEGSEEEGRRKIMAFKDRLTAMGKESLFFRWVELIQYESSQPGGFTPERQARAVAKAKALFDEQGVDLDEFAQVFGGVHGMPGMEDAPTQ